MTKIVSISEAQTQLRGLLAVARNDGDEVIIEENGELLARLVPIEKLKPQKQRTAGLGKGYWMSEDFDDELPDEFWGFDKEL